VKASRGLAAPRQARAVPTVTARKAATRKRTDAETERDPLPDQRGNRTEADLGSTQALMGFPAAILTLWELWSRIVGASRPPVERPEWAASSVVEQEFKRRLDALPTEDELRVEFSRDELDRVFGEVDASLRAIGAALCDGKIGVLMNRWWKTKKIRDRLSYAAAELKGKPTLEAFDTKAAPLKQEAGLKAFDAKIEGGEYVRVEKGRYAFKLKRAFRGKKKLPTWTQTRIQQMIAREVGGEHGMTERQLRRLLADRPDDRIDPASIDPRLRKRRRPSTTPPRA